MKRKGNTETLEESLLDCSVVIFGKNDLYGFIDALENRDYFSGIGNITKFDFKFSEEKSVTEINFYAVSHKWEIARNIRELLNDKARGFGYCIKRIEEQ